VGRQECTPGTGPQQQPTSQAPASAPPSTPSGNLDTNPPEGNTGGNTGGGSLGGPVGSRPEPNPTTAEPTQPAAETTQQAQPVATQVAQPQQDTCEPGKFAAAPALVATAGAGLAAALAIGLLLAASLRRPVPVSGPPVSGPPAAGGRVPAGADPRLDADRAALVRACIYVRDRVTSRALADRLAAALRDAGVTVVEPVGDRFDPSRHEAGGATPVSDPSLTGTIAAVEVPGYIDRSGRVLRAPVVTVYQAGSGGAGSTTGQHSTIPHSTTQRTSQHRRRTEEDR
jgi:hypothetical protein